VPGIHGYGHDQKRLTCTAEAIQPIIPNSFYHGDDVHMGVRNSVRHLSQLDTLLAVGIDSQCRFFVTSFVNGGGPAMISGFVVAFLGALATCASYV